MFLFLFQFLMRYLGELVGKGLSNWVIIQLITLNLSWMFVLAVPMGVLFSTLMSFGNLSANYEITIIKASGGGLMKMMLPVIFFGILLTGFLFWFNDNVLPETNHQAKVLLNDITRKKPTFSIEAGQFSTQLEGCTILARSIDSISGMLKGVTIYDNTRGNKTNVISADTGTIEFSPDYTKLIMLLYSGEIHQIMPLTVRDYNRINFKKYKFITNASGFAFERSSEGMVSRGDREMRISDMKKIINEADKNANAATKRIQTQIEKHYEFLNGKSGEGDLTVFSRDIHTPAKTQELRHAQQRIEFLKTTVASDLMQKQDYNLRAQEYWIEVQKKYSIPFACLIFVLIGAPLGIMTKGGNFGISAAISLGFYVFYWACLIGGEKLGDRGLLPPFISMWGGNFLIALIGIVLTIRVNNESVRFPGARLIANIQSRLIKYLSKAK